MNTIKILTSQALPGMVVSEDIFTDDYHLIIAKDTVLTDKIISRLKFYSIKDFHIYSDDKIIETETNFLESTFYNNLKKSETFKRFYKAYNNSANRIKDAMDDFIANPNDINTDDLLSEVRNILHQCDTGIGLFHMLHCMREFDDTTYIHSLNVSLICNIIGKWLNLSSEDLKIITIAGLLHDIGKLLIPNEIITKPSKLTDDEFSLIKTHTIEGYNILKDTNLDERIKNVVLMHHERCDGSGYPKGLTRHEIDPFARLVAIADVYDAMTSARVYRGPLCPFEVIKLFETEGYMKYDIQYILSFLEGVVQTYINNTVRLNNKMEGVIVFINKYNLSRPVVMCKDKFIDLSKQQDLYIEALI